MKYLYCVWLCLLWLMCQKKCGIFGLHIEQAPEILQRITRQATRYSSAGLNYRPVSGSASGFNVRNAASDLTAGLSSFHANSAVGNSGQKAVGVGAYSFGGMASGRPANGNSFAISSGSKSGAVRTAQPNTVQTIVGSGSVAGSSVGAGRPQQHLQQALLQAAQYQLQQQQQQQQQQQYRRQIPQQQLYRQRPATAFNQFN